MAKYQNGRKLSVGWPENDDEDLLVESDDDDKGEESNTDFVQFALDRSKWKWVVGLYGLYLHVRNELFIAQSRKVPAILSRYCAPRCVVHADGWKRFNVIPKYELQDKGIVNKELYIDPYTEGKQ